VTFSLHFMYQITKKTLKKYFGTFGVSHFAKFWPTPPGEGAQSQSIPLKKNVNHYSHPPGWGGHPEAMA